MTFSNILNGVLFFGAFQQLLHALNELTETGDLNDTNIARLIMASTLAILIANDVIFISHHVEGEQSVQYRAGLMLIDLMTFLCGAFAFVLLSNFAHIYERNFLEVELGENIPSWSIEALFWLMLALYWLTIIWWTKRACVYTTKRYPKGLRGASFIIAVVFFVEFLLVSFGWGEYAKPGRLIALLYILAYFIARTLYFRFRKPLPSVPCPTATKSLGPAPTDFGHARIRLVAEGIATFEGDIPRV